MPRKPRNFELHQIYHIVKRGVDGREIFSKPQDASRFIFGLEFFNNRKNIDLWNVLASSKGVSDTPLRQRLEQERKKPQNPIVEILAFALMPNHIHIILREITERGISLFMQRLSGYSRYFNHQYKRAGPLFGSRFKAVKVKDDIQLHTVFVYVHTNPVALWEPGWKEFQVKNPDAAIQKLEQYKLSSYSDYIGNQMHPTVIKRDFFLDFYGSEEKCRQAVENWIRSKAKQSGPTPEMLE